MTNTVINVFMLSFCAAALLTACSFVVIERKCARLVRLVVTLLAFAGAVVWVALASPGQNVVMAVIHGLKTLDRTLCPALAAGAFAGLLAGWGMDSWSITGRRTVVSMAAYVFAWMAFSLVVLKPVISPYLSEPGNQGNGVGLINADVPDGFQLQDVHTLKLSH